MSFLVSVLQQPNLAIDMVVRLLFSNIARQACQQFVKSMKLTPRLIMSREGDSVYLERYYLLGGCSEDGEEWDKDAPLQVYLHRFRRSDDDIELHSHPWLQSVSFVLAGGYIEQRRDDDNEVVSRAVLPFDFNFIAADDFHRVDLLEDDCWSIFVTSKKTGKSWGFWHPKTGAFKGWREFIAEKRGVDPSTIDDNVRGQART